MKDDYIHIRKSDYKAILVIQILAVVFYSLVAIYNIVTTSNKNNYIQNIETKLNIYEQSYEEKVIEDNLKQ